MAAGMEAGWVTEISSFLEANGGAMPLGKVTRQFKGLKKAQVAEFFALTVGENPNDPVVSTSELSGTQLAEAVARSKEMSTAGAQAKAATDASGEVPPLDAGKVVEIASFLEANGGALNLGKLSRQFRGVKKAQLEKQFFVEIAEGAPDFMVSLTPGGGLLAPLASQRSVPAATAAWGGAPAAGAGALATAATAPAKPLTADAVQSIAATLSQSGGVLSLGKLSRAFPGLKKVSLEQHFPVVHDGQQGPMVYLQGAQLGVAPMAQASRGPGRTSRPPVVRTAMGTLAAGSFGGRGFGNTAVVPFGGRGAATRTTAAGQWTAAGQFAQPGTAQSTEPASAFQIEARLPEVTAWIEGNGGSVCLGRLTRQFRGLKKAQLMPYFSIGQGEGESDLCVSLPGCEASAAAPAPHKRPRLDPADGTAQQPAQEAPPMDASQVQEVISFLEASNGSLPLGKVTRAFRGIKKAQLAQHFTMTVTDNPQDPVVSVGEPNPAVLNDLLVAAANKKAKKGDGQQGMASSLGPLC